MLPPATVQHLNKRGHDAVSVHDVDLAGAEDDDIFRYAALHGRVIVTENFADYSALIEQRLNDEQPCVPVVFVHKSDFPGRGALPDRLAAHLDAWAIANPDPYIGPH